MNTPEPDIIITGAGIGGLSCALCLANQGISSLILEKSETPTEAGAGIQLGPNAFHILKHLGLEQELERDASFPEKIVMYDAASGGALAHMPLIPQMQRRHKAPYAVIHRAELHKILRARAEQSDKITLKYASSLSNFIDEGHCVTVQTMDRENYTARALIGADGLWSTVRDLILDDGPPRFTGQVAWRAVVRRDSVEERFKALTTGLWLGERAHLVHYPISNGQLLNIVAIIEMTDTPNGWSTKGEADNLLQCFENWAKPAYSLLKQVTEWRMWALYDRDPVPAWGVGRITLLGDAAHPMLPFLAQGGAMAIEDAYILAAFLKGNLKNPRSALRSYENARIKRTSRVVETSRSNATMFHLGGPQRLMRNMALKTSTAVPGLLLKKYDWLYGYKAHAEKLENLSQA